MYQGEGAGPPAPCASQSSDFPSVEGPRRAGTTSQRQPPLFLLPSSVPHPFLAGHSWLLEGKCC